MQFLKGLAIGLLSFLLFLSLTVLGLAITLNYTILNPDFVASQIDELDIASLMKEQLDELDIDSLMEEQLQLPFDTEFITVAIDDTITDLEPWMKEQLSAGIYTGYDYLTGKSQSLDIAISTEPVEESLRDNLWEALQESPPPELAALPSELVEQYFNQFFEQEISGKLPPVIEFDESMLPSEAIPIIEQVRQGFASFQLGYKVLIGVSLLLILGIVLIDLQVRGATRRVGTTFTVVGAFGLIETLLIKNLIWPQIPQDSIPTQLQTWIPQLLGGLLYPLQMFSIGLLVVGVALLIVSFVYKPYDALV